MKYLTKDEEIRVLRSEVARLKAINEMQREQMGGTHRKPYRCQTNSNGIS